MAFAVTSKGAPLASLLKNLCLAAPSSSSSSFLGPACVAAAIRGLYSTGDYYYEPSIGDELVLYHHQLPACSIPCSPPQDEDVVQVKVPMLGLPAERVKVWTNKKGLFIKGEGEGVKGPDGVVQVQGPVPYSCHIELSADAFDLDKAQAEMKHGLLKVTVPKVKRYFTEIKVLNVE